MLLKLIWPNFDLAIEKGVIVKWYKKEQEQINYGDDIFDLHIKECKALERSQNPRVLSIFANAKEKWKGKFWTRKVDMLVRISSSDLGILNRICITEGSECNVNDVVATIRTNTNEVLSQNHQLFEQMGIFRVVGNVITQELINLGE